MGAFIHAQAREGLMAVMRDCEQTPGMSVLRHGEMVADFFRDLVDQVRDGNPLRHEWRLPDWITDPLLWSDLPDPDLISEYHLFHDCVINTPPDASTDSAYRPSRLRVKTTMAITDADQDESPDIRSMIIASTILREMKPSGVEPDITFNHEGGIHLSWTGDGWEIEAGVERDGHFDWVCETQHGAISQSDGLIAPQDTVTTVQLILGGVIQDDTTLLPTKGLARV